jgi:hypothetical protein
MFKDDPIRLPASRGRFTTVSLTREDARRQFQLSLAMMGILIAILGIGIVANLAQSAGAVLQ